MTGRIGELIVEEALGQGGMGRVLLCRDPGLDRHVAVKVLHPNLVVDELMRARFLREARALAKVRSPHVVAVHAVGEDEDAGPYMVMERLEGEDLQHRLARVGKLSVDEATAAVRDACQGLVAVHSTGLLHRDIKPANLFVGPDGRTKLTDFGLAREAPTPDSVGIGAAALTQTGLIVGTPAYLAPEIVKGGQASSASDIYALGATLYHLLAGRPPFPGDAPLEVLAAVVREPPPPVTAFAEVPAWVASAVQRMLEKDPARRPQSAEEVLRLLSSQALSTPLPTPARAFPSPTLVLGSVPGASTDSSSSRAGDLPRISTPSTPPLRATTSPVPDATSLPDVSPSSLTPRVKTATLTVMMTDIAGYATRRSQQSRQEAARRLALHEGLLTPLFRAFFGKVVKTIGDAFLVTFSSPTDAVLCGTAVQDQLWLHNQSASDEDRLEVRVAISAGEVRVHKGDIFGEPVNVVARLQALARPGEVLLSDAVYATMNVAEVTMASCGMHELTGIGRPVHVYSVMADTSGATPPYRGRALSSVAPLHQAPQSMAKRFVRQVAGLPVVAWAFIVLVSLGGIVVAKPWASDRRARIAQGQAQAVKAEIEAIASAERKIPELQDLGLALFALDDKKHAYMAFEEVLKRHAGGEVGDLDDALVDRALLDLSQRHADAAVQLLVAWPDVSVEQRLRAQLRSTEYLLRKNALDVLEKRKAAQEEDHIVVALQDVEEADCGRRRLGLLRLKKSGRGPASLSAVKKLGSEMPRNLCMAFDVGSAEAAIQKRSKP